MARVLNELMIYHHTVIQTKLYWIRLLLIQQSLLLHEQMLQLIVQETLSPSTHLEVVVLLFLLIQMQIIFSPALLLVLWQIREQASIHLIQQEQHLFLLMYNELLMNWIVVIFLYNLNSELHKVIQVIFKLIYDQLQQGLLQQRERQIHYNLIYQPSLVMLSHELAILLQ